MWKRRSSSWKPSVYIWITVSDQFIGTFFVHMKGYTSVLPGGFWKHIYTNYLSHGTSKFKQNLQQIKTETSHYFAFLTLFLYVKSFTSLGTSLASLFCLLLGMRNNTVGKFQTNFLIDYIRKGIWKIGLSHFLGSLSFRCWEHVVRAYIKSKMAEAIMESN